MKKITNLKNIVLSVIMVMVISGTMSFVNGQTVTPASHEECEYYIGTLSFSVRGLIGSTYQWYTAPYRSLEWVAIPGATSNVLSLTFNKFNPYTSKEYNRRQFKCYITPIKGTPGFSDIAYTYVLIKPSISGHPESATKYIGESVTFSISTSGSTPKYYQWQLDKGTGYADILGATSTSYSISSVGPDDAGNYRCIVWNACGTVYSNAATLTVLQLTWPEGWFSQKENTNPENAKYMYDVHAIDQYHTWAAIGEISDNLLYTNDGGVTWTYINTNVTNKSYWQTVFFTDTNHGWVAGYKVIAYTTNGGTSWSQWYDAATNYFSDLYFISSTTGWAVGYEGRIYKTTDGGVTWNPQTSGTNANLNQVHFADASHGIVVGQSGTIVYTIDGGINWLTPSTNPAEVALNAVFMTHTDTAFIAGSYQAGQSYPYYYMHMKTTDGGATWTKISGPPNTGYDLKFANSKLGWMASGSGKIYFTNNGGANWYEQATETSQTLYAISMADAENGWAVGYAGAMQRTAMSGCLHPTMNLYEDVASCASDPYTIYADTFKQNVNCFYLWNTGATTGSLTVNETGLYSVVVTNLCGETATDSKQVLFYPLPEAYAGEDVNICPGDTVQLIASGGEEYVWTPGWTLNDDSIQNPRAFPYTTTYYTVSVTDSNGCVDYDDVVVNLQHPYEDEEICLVTVDPETEKNMVIWEKTEGVGIESYNVYRESVTADVYELIGNVPFDNLSVFIDVNSQPEVKSYKYKISVVDTCGNESTMSPYHKTMLLVSNLGPTSINLSWTEYVVESGGFGFVKYLIYRGDASDNLALLDSIASDNTSYPDYDPPAGRMYYRVAGVKATKCYPSVTNGKKAGTGPYSQSMSNLEDNRLQTGVKDLRDGVYNLMVYPNPFRQQTKISYRLDKPSDVKIEVFNLLGARTADIVNARQNPGDFSYDLNASDMGVAEGVFYLRFTVNGNTTVKKLILTK